MYVMSDSLGDGGLGGRERRIGFPARKVMLSPGQVQTRVASARMTGGARMGMRVRGVPWVCQGERHKILYPEGVSGTT